MSGLFWSGLMCSDRQCTQMVFIAEAVGFFGLPLIIGIYCCCNYRKWQRIEEEREAKREKLIAKSRRHYDPIDRQIPSYGTYETMQMEEGRGSAGEPRGPPRAGVIERAVELHRSGELNAQNMRNVPDF